MGRRSRGKKNKNATEANQNSQPAPPLPSKEECGNLFDKALNQIEGGGKSQGEWLDVVDLSNCRIGDKRAKRIAQALTDSSSVTVLDCSCNTITDDGAAVLCEALARGGAPRLLLLDLSRNNINTKEPLVASLAERPDLVLQLERPEGQEQPGQEEGPLLEQEECMPEPPSSEADTPPSYAPPSPIKCGEDSSSYVAEALQTIKNQLAGDVSELTEALETLLQVLRTDMQSGALASFRCVAANLKIFRAVLERPAQAHEHSHGLQEQGLGVSRYLAASIVSLCAKLPGLHADLLEHGVCLLLVKLFFEFEFSSGLHCAVQEMVAAVLEEGGLLRQSVLCDAEAGLLPQMHQVVMSPGLHHSTIGLRSGVVGPLVEMAAAIGAKAEAEHQLQAELERCQWAVLQPRLETVRQEQQGGLGPEPAKPNQFGDMSDMSAFLRQLPPGAQQQLLSQMMGFRTQ